MVRFLIFVLAIFLTGVIYVKTTKKIIDKSLKFKVSLYSASMSLIALLFFSAIIGEVFIDMFGGLTNGIISTISTFLACYFILPISNKFMREK